MSLCATEDESRGAATEILNYKIGYIITCRITFKLIETIKLSDD